MYIKYGAHIVKCFCCQVEYITFNEKLLKRFKKLMNDRRLNAWLCT